MRRNLEAFTLFEVIIVLGIVLIISLVAIPIGISEFRTNKVENTAIDMRSLVQSSQQNAYTRKNDSSYGIRFNSESFDLFQGESVATATSVETIELENGVYIENVNLSNALNEFYFPAGELMPDATVSIDISDGAKSFRLEINSEGLINTYRL